MSGIKTRFAEEIEREWWLTGQYDCPMIAITQKPDGESVHVVEATPEVLMAKEMREVLENVLGQFNDRDCGCDGEYVDGRIVGHACYFHRIEEDVRYVLSKFKAPSGGGEGK